MGRMGEYYSHSFSFSGVKRNKRRETRRGKKKQKEGKKRFRVGKSAEISEKRKENGKREKDGMHIALNKVIRNI